MQTRIGISGWRYPPWRGVFYPTGLSQRRELEFASRQVNTIEINGSFYSLQTPSSYGQWHAQTPEGFVFAVKGPRYITHLRRLKEVETPLANFFASGVLRLGDKLGPILWQLPPFFPFNADRLAAFFDLLPRDTQAAAKLARTHDAKLKSRAWSRTDAHRPLRHALEVRHPSFVTPAFVELLRAHRIGLVVADTAGKWPFMEDVTADFVYARLHGDEQLYVSGYTPEALERWAQRARTWQGAGCDVFVYFDNDVKVHAPFDAMSLAHQLGVGEAPPTGHDPALVTEEPRTMWAPIRATRRRSAPKIARTGRK